MRLLLVDRDGVINEEDAEYVRSPQAWRPIPGSLEAIGRATRAGFRVIVVSNQSGLGRGHFTIDDLNQIHLKMLRELAKAGGAVEAIFFCPHAPEADCACRKPRTGLFDEIARRLRVPLTGVPVVVDRLSDIQAARAVGAQPWLVLTGQGKRTLRQSEGIEDVPVYADLSAAVDHLLATLGSS